MALTIALADDIEKVVTEQARAAGVSPRDFVNQTLSATLTPNGDPLDEFIGRFESGIPDLAVATTTICPPRTRTATRRNREGILRRHVRMVVPGRPEPTRVPRRPIHLDPTGEVASRARHHNQLCPRRTGCAAGQSNGVAPI